MLVLSDSNTINNLSGRINEKIVIVGDEVCPAVFTKGQLAESNLYSDYVSQMPIFPNVLSGSMSEKLHVFLAKDSVETLKRYKKNVYLGVDLLLRWGKQVKSSKSYTVIGVYENQLGKIHLQILTYQKGVLGSKLVSYEERESNSGGVTSLLSWTIEKLLDGNDKEFETVEHVYLAFGKEQLIDKDKLDTPGVTLVGDEPFNKAHHIPLRFSKKNQKVPIVPYLTTILFGFCLYIGTHTYVKSQYDEALHEYDQAIVGIEDVYAGNKANSSINLIQQRQYFLESLDSRSHPSMQIKRILNAINDMRGDGFFRNIKLVDISFENTGANRRVFSVKLALNKQRPEININDTFQQLVVTLGEQLNVELYSMSLPKNKKTDDEELTVFHVGGEFTL